MRILTINCGSSSLKLSVFAVFDRSAPLRDGGLLDFELARVADGEVQNVGGDAELEATIEGGARTRAAVAARDHREAVARALEWLRANGLDDPPDAVGHRVVHGGPELREPVRLDARSLAAIEEATRLAPLHNAPALAAIEATRAAFGDGVPQVATFDTAFHRSMPPRAARYAIDPELADRHALYRYGFHGLAHGSMAQRAAELLGRPLEELRLITLQLGSGCSACAIEGGRSVDTSMGLTPLEGLVMGTRSGDVDPSLPAALAAPEGITVDEALALLNRRSGLLGVSGRSADVRELLAAEAAGDERAALALEMFCYRVRKQVGGYLAALEGCDAIVFGGGIGEHQPEVRRRILAGLAWAGAHLDAARNASARGGDAFVSADGSAIAALVVAVDEEVMIARDALQCVASEGVTP